MHVCRFAWWAVLLGISLSSYTRIRRLAKGETTNLNKSTSRRRTESVRGKDKSHELIKLLYHTCYFWYKVIVLPSFNCSLKTNLYGLLQKQLWIFLGDTAVGYMSYYVSLMGDKSPTEERIILPMGVTIKEIFKEYAAVHHSNPIEESQFYYLWKKHFKHVSYQKVCVDILCYICLEFQSVSY